MNSVQIEQKSYEMPPQEGISIAHFLTVANIERSARYYETVFGARILSLGDGNAPAYLPAREYLDDFERRGRTDTGQADGNAQRSRPESHQQLYEFPRCGYSSVL
jgi:predicted enzyme related to lactoylglutathione lyase